ncbi:MAG: hypothetical protein NVS3B26_23300 [Mycobacteriales bacterium]
MTVAVSQPAPFTAQGAPSWSARKQLDVITAYREVGTYRAAAEICGVDPKTVKRIVIRDQAAAERAERRKNYESVRALVAKARFQPHHRSRAVMDREVPRHGIEQPPGI